MIAEADIAYDVIFTLEYYYITVDIHFALDVARRPPMFGAMEEVIEIWHDYDPYM